MYCTYIHTSVVTSSCHTLSIFLRFRPPLVKDVIHLVLKETLHEKQYSSEEAKTLTKEISDSIQTRLKGIGT